MNCPNCNALMSHQKESYHYIESGLNNVYLEEMDIYKCECGEEIVTIPAIPELHTLIGIILIRKKYLLDGKEIRFLRKNLGLTAKKLAGIIGVDNATISRWENDNQSMSGPNDKLLRLVYLQIKGIPAEDIKIEEDFPEIQPEHTEMSDLFIPQSKWAKDKEVCSL